ncbi:MAG: 4-hydroxy-tetrahydrodipicolinate reductase [Candidatus Omnitrophota bacterium]|nr:4-hydroxy-tetrahydrodipicolinate reductase [Candidatus Omnitrophota bacterium]
MIRIAISGISGRMGMRIGALAGQDKDIEIAGAIEASSSPAIGRDIGELLGIGKMGKKVEADFKNLASLCDVLIEFTSPGATLEHLDTAIKNKKAVVIGTTGFSKEEAGKIKEASSKIPIVFSPNMSVGANLLFKITEEVAGALGKDYAVEIVEAHHDQKKDAPSGTAKRLGEAVSKVKGKIPPIHSVRLGDIVGDHTVIFAGNGERIELTHRAHSRDAFAKGSISAAKFLAGKKPGLYTMADVIGA